MRQAHAELVGQIEALDPALAGSDDTMSSGRDEETRFLVRAHRHLDVIRGLEFAAVISGAHNDDPAWREWSDKGKRDARINRFKKPLMHRKPENRDGLALLIVKSMLLTGFDAPVEQVLYLDRFMQGHELLQAIARVNRTAERKTCGLVVDYFGIGERLKLALAVYSAEDIEGALVSIKDELPRLADRHQRVLAVFHSRGIPDIADDEACVELLRDIQIRAEFVVKLGQFLESLDIVMPRPEALPYLRDAKLLGFINKSAANRYRDSQLNIVGAGMKVRELIDRHIESRGINPKVPPVSITDAEFDRAVEGKVSERAKASEMEHAARYHISRHFNEDPAHYKKLSERLEEILRGFADNWEGLVRALRDFCAEVREGRQRDDSGLDPQTQAPFLGVLVDETGVEPGQRERMQKLIAATVDLVDHIRQEIRMRDFWRNTHGQTVLRGWIVQYLDRENVVVFERQEATADRLVQLAKARHVNLTT
jgi:type I restriction enzyme R subunit